MRGFATTPIATVDTMVDLLFRDASPSPQSRLLDPGCGTGVFIDGVIRWCERRGACPPQIVGVELDGRHIQELENRFAQHKNVVIENKDFLDRSTDTFDYIVGNPPYVPITDLTAAEKARYRLAYTAARGRFDLYILFFEQALNLLAPDGRLVFITPEKFMYVDTAAVLRHLLASRHVEEIRLLNESTFGDLVTYPTVTVMSQTGRGVTRIVKRNGSVRNVLLPLGLSSWQPYVEGGSVNQSTQTLIEICSRLSCGVATGADSVFVKDPKELGPELSKFAVPTLAGRELKDATSAISTTKVMLVPYDQTGQLLPESDLGELGSYLRGRENYDRLLARTCVRRKPWYAFHETPDVQSLLRPKIVWKDITSTPRFWVDESGEIVPRHSVYYLVPKHADAIAPILEYLRSEFVRSWLANNCQRAAKGYLRLQSAVLKRLPIPASLADEVSYKAQAPLSENLQLIGEQEMSIA